VHSLQPRSRSGKIPVSRWMISPLLHYFHLFIYLFIITFFYFVFQNCNCQSHLITGFYSAHLHKHNCFYITKWKRHTVTLNSFVYFRCWHIPQSSAERNWSSHIMKDVKNHRGLWRYFNLVFITSISCSLSIVIY